MYNLFFIQLLSISYFSKYLITIVLGLILTQTDTILHVNLIFFLFFKRVYEIEVDNRDKYLNSLLYTLKIEFFELEYHSQMIWFISWIIKILWLRFPLGSSPSSQVAWSINCLFKNIQNNIIISYRAAYTTTLDVTRILLIYLYYL